MLNQQDILEKAIEIAKEYVRGGGAAPAAILEQVYKKIEELNKEG